MPLHLPRGQKIAVSVGVDFDAHSVWPGSFNMRTPGVLSRGEFGALGPAQFERNKAYVLPDATDEAFKAWCRHYAIGFYDIRAWMDYLRRFDFVTGTRFHGVMLALQAGAPNVWREKLVKRLEQKNAA